MSQTILFQTDFTLNSLRGVKKVLAESSSTDPLTIILLHGFRLDDSINELLFFNKAQKIKELSDSTFRDACKVLINKHASSIKSFEIDLFTGWNQNAFTNYVEAKSVDRIYIVEDTFQVASSASFDLSTFFNKSSIAKKTLFERAETEILQPEKGNLAEIFVL